MIEYFLKENDLQAYLGEFLSAETAMHEHDDVKHEMKAMLTSQLDAAVTRRLMEIVTPETARTLGELVAAKSAPGTVQRFLLEQTPDLITEIQHELAEFKAMYIKPVSH